MILAYCAGLIAVCTGLLIIATAFTLQNYWMLRRLSESPSGKHDADRADAPQRRVERYDSGDPGDAEWTGPVTVYTPPERG